MLTILLRQLNVGKLRLFPFNVPTHIFEGEFTRSNKSPVHREGSEYVPSLVNANFFFFTLRSVYSCCTLRWRHYHDVRLQYRFWQFHSPVWLVAFAPRTETFKPAACASSIEPQTEAAIETLRYLLGACEEKLVSRGQDTVGTEAGFQERN